MSFNDISQNPGSTVTVGTAKNTNTVQIRTQYFNGSTLTYSEIRTEAWQVLCELTRTIKKLGSKF